METGEHKKEIIKTIPNLSGKYAPYNIFSDWVEMCSLAVQNGCHVIHDKVWREREQRYIDTARKYSETEMEQFARMFVLLGDALTESLSDVLGEIYMEHGAMRQDDAEVLKQIRAVCAEYLMRILPAEMAVEEIIGILQDHMHGVRKYDKRRKGGN